MGSFKVVSGATTKKEQGTGQPCPECGKPIVEGSDHCYHCGCFFDSTGTRVLKPGEVSDEKMEELIMLSQRLEEEHARDPRTIKSNNIMKKGMLVLALGCIITFLGSPVLGVILMVGSVVGVIYLTGKIAKPIPQQVMDGGQLNTMIARYVAPGVLDHIFDEVMEYDPDGHFPYEEIDRSRLIYKDYSVYGGNRYIKAVYKGTPLEFSNISLQDYSTDEEGKRHYKTVFSGIWLGVSLGMTISEEIRIQKKSLGYSLKNSIKTDHEEFNKRFFVSCKDEAAAFTFLTPQVMEAILKVDDIAGGKTSIFVDQNGYVQIAANGSKNIINNTDFAETIPQMRERMDDEIRTVLMIPDNLTRIYKD